MPFLRNAERAHARRTHLLFVWGRWAGVCKVRRTNNGFAYNARSAFVCFFSFAFAIFCHCKPYANARVRLRSFAILWTIHRSALPGNAHVFVFFANGNHSLDFFLRNRNLAVTIVGLQKTQWRIAWFAPLQCLLSGTLFVCTALAPCVVLYEWGTMPQEGSFHGKQEQHF